MRLVVLPVVGFRISHSFVSQSDFREWGITCELYLPFPMEETDFGTNDGCLWRVVETFYQPFQLFGIENSVVVHEEQIPALCHINAEIVSTSEPKVLLTFHHSNRWVSFLYGVRLAIP